MEKSLKESGKNDPLYVIFLSCLGTHNEVYRKKLFSMDGQFQFMGPQKEYRSSNLFYKRIRDAIIKGKPDPQCRIESFVDFDFGDKISKPKKKLQPEHMSYKILNHDTLNHDWESLAKICKIKLGLTPEAPLPESTVTPSRADTEAKSGKGEKDTH
jgi:hypothetical protein